MIKGACRSMKIREIENIPNTLKATQKSVEKLRQIN